MLAGEHFGRRHHRRLPPRLDHLRHRDQRNHGLARADVALQEPDHALFGRKIGADFVDRLALRPGQRERQRRLEPPAQRALGGMRPPGDPAHPRAHQKQRELVRQQFVVSQPGRGGPGRVDVRGRRWGGAWRRAPPRIPAASRRRSVSAPIHSGRRGRALQRALGRARDRALEETLGQAVDRLDRRQFCELLGVQHPVGMNDLPVSVPQLELARNPAGRADWQARAHPGMIGEEEHEFDVAGLVLDQHLERGARTRVGRLVMLGDLRLDGDDRVGDGVADLGARAPVERGVGQVEEHVHDPRALGLAEEPVEELGVLRPDSRQRAGGREQRVEKGRAHGRLIARRAGRLEGRASLSGLPDTCGALASRTCPPGPAAQRSHRCCSAPCGIFAEIG